MTRFSCASKNLPFLKAREGMSAISLSAPAMCIGNNDDAFRVRCLIARRRSRRPAMIDFDVVNLYVHATAEVLSQNMPMCLKTRSSHTYSNTIHPITIPASSRSLIVMVPFLFVDVTRLCLMSSGHSYCHTQYCIGSSPGVITPPAPSAHASVY